jgi:hypothetical protein
VTDYLAIFFNPTAETARCSNVPAYYFHNVPAHHLSNPKSARNLSETDSLQRARGRGKSHERNKRFTSLYFGLHIQFDPCTYRL